MRSLLQHDRLCAFLRDARGRHARVGCSAAEPAGPVSFDRAQRGDALRPPFGDLLRLENMWVQRDVRGWTLAVEDRHESVRGWIEPAMTSSDVDRDVPERTQGGTAPFARCIWAPENLLEMKALDTSPRLVLACRNLGGRGSAKYLTRAAMGRGWGFSGVFAVLSMSWTAVAYADPASEASEPPASPSPSTLAAAATGSACPRALQTNGEIRSRA